MTSCYVVVMSQLAGGEDVMGKSDRGLHPHDIDAFWLQRKLSKHYDDPMLAQTRAGEVLAILKVCHPTSHAVKHVYVQRSVSGCTDVTKIDA